MPSSRARSAVDWLLAGPHTRPHITFWGGEPLLERDLIDELIRRGRDLASVRGKRLSLSMPTNATLLDDETLRWLAHNRVRIFLSIDGDEETQAERIMASGESSFPLVRDALERAMRLKAEHVPPVRMTVTPRNAARLPGNVEFFSHHGVRELMTYPAFDTDWSGAAVKTMARAELAVAERLISWIESAADPRDVIRLKAWMPTLRRLHFGGPRRQGNEALNGCGAGTELVALNVDGSFSACHRFTFYARGDPMKLGSLEQGVGEEGLQAFADLTWSRQRGVTRCTTCDLFDLCSLGCVAINFATTGSLTRVPEAACELMRARVRACRRVHDALCDNPLYPLYLGQSPDAALGRVTRRISRRAWQQYTDTRIGGRP